MFREFERIKKDCSYFLKLGKEKGLKLLKAHEQAGTLPKFIKKVAPDYYHTKDEIQSFVLISDLGWWE